MVTRFWAIADTHLSFAKPKNMARFGNKWANHEAVIAEHWRAQIAADDVVLLPGDVSWAGSPNKALPDLHWLAGLPGTKILLRGNHDHWWRSADAVRKIAEPHGFHILEGDSITLHGVIVCGAMGHVAPVDPYYKVDPKKDRYKRELIRLESALQHANAARAPDQPVILMMHYPPFSSDGQPTAYSELIRHYQPTMCLYGHLHHESEWLVAANGERDGVLYRLVAADFIEMTPQVVWTSEE